MAEEQLNLTLAPNEHLGHKVYEPRDVETVMEINRTVELYKEELGLNSAKFVQLLIMEGRPEYSGYSPKNPDESMGVHARIYQRRAKRDSFKLIEIADEEASDIRKMIEQAKMEGAANGISEPNNIRLKELGRAAVLVSSVLNEISQKYPQKYLEYRETKPPLTVH